MTMKERTAEFREYYVTLDGKVIYPQDEHEAEKRVKAFEWRVMFAQNNERSLMKDGAGAR